MKIKMNPLRSNDSRAEGEGKTDDGRTVYLEFFPITRNLQILIDNNIVYNHRNSNFDELNPEKELNRIFEGYNENLRCP